MSSRHRAAGRCSWMRVGTSLHRYRKPEIQRYRMPAQFDRVINRVATNSSRRYRSYLYGRPLAEDLGNGRISMYCGARADDILIVSIDNVHRPAESKPARLLEPYGPSTARKWPVVGLRDRVSAFWNDHVGRSSSTCWDILPVARGAWMRVALAGSRPRPKREQLKSGQAGGGDGEGAFRETHIL